MTPMEMILVNADLHLRANPEGPGQWLIYAGNNRVSGSQRWVYENKSEGLEKIRSFLEWRDDMITQGHALMETVSLGFFDAVIAPKAPAAPVEIAP